MVIWAVQYITYDWSFHIRFTSENRLTFWGKSWYIQISFRWCYPISFLKIAIEVKGKSVWIQTKSPLSSFLEHINTYFAPECRARFISTMDDQNQGHNQSFYNVKLRITPDAFNELQKHNNPQLFMRDLATGTEYLYNTPYKKGFLAHYIIGSTAAGRIHSSKEIVLLKMTRVFAPRASYYVRLEFPQC